MIFASWNNPSKLSAQDLSVVFGLPNGGTGTVSEELLPNATSYLTSIGGGADGAISANLWLTGRDAYDRSFNTNLTFGSNM